jgi:Zn-finger nucleic acid-binding protein
MTEAVCCPNCGERMIEENFGRARVDVCADGCHGIWFAWDELQLVDRQGKGMGPALERALQAEPRDIDDDRVLDCPGCGVELEAGPYAIAPTVRIDQCADCGGIFLDAGELADLRQQPLTKQEVARRRMGRRRRRRRRRLKEEQRKAAAVMVGIMIMIG